MKIRQAKKIFKRWLAVTRKSHDSESWEKHWDWVDMMGPKVNTAIARVGRHRRLARRKNHQARLLCRRHARSRWSEEVVKLALGVFEP